MNRFSFEAHGKAAKSIRVGADLRVTVLTPCLLRLEKGNHTDEPTQTVWNRRFSDVNFDYQIKDGKLVLTTDETVFTIDIRSTVMQQILLSDGTIVNDFEKGNLLGTARTLDNVNGSINCSIKPD